MYTAGELCDHFFDFDIARDNDDLSCLQRCLNSFCNSGTKEDAFTVYFSFCEIFKVFGSGFDTMDKLLAFLSDHEYHSGELLTRHRDHYSHSVYVFVLGLAIYAGDGGLRRIFSDFYGEDWSATDFLHLWGLSALFHDIGYPFQLAHAQIRNYVEELWGNANERNPFVSFGNMQSILSLDRAHITAETYREAHTIDQLLIQGIHHRLGYPLDVLNKLILNRYDNQQQYLDHGYFSALLLTYRLIESDTRFSDPIVDVLTAIALHNNLNKYDIPDELHHPVPVAPDRHPLAYMLILCDELQNWNRTPFGYISKKDPLAWKVLGEIDDEHIRFDYVFDSFNVVDTRVGAVNAATDAHSIVEYDRPNRNVTALQDGSFTRDILALIQCHTTLCLNAAEEPKKRRTRLVESADKFVNLCDFAKAIHGSYQCLYGGDSFESLSLSFKLSNIDQAKSYSEKLEMVNCFYSDRELDFEVVKEFSSTEHTVDPDIDDLGLLSRTEHLRWVNEKLADGWEYGTDFHSTAERNAKKIHNCLLPFDFLSEVDKDKDASVIRNMVPLLYEYGHGIRIYRYTGHPRETLNIAVIGHRTISSSREVIREKLRQILDLYRDKYRVTLWTNLASGADMLAAECAVESGIALKAVIPFDYEDHISYIREDSIATGYTFGAEQERRLRRLLAQTLSCTVVKDKQYVHRGASQYILDKCDCLLAIWDGVATPLVDEAGNPINQGGTYYGIQYVRNVRGLPESAVHIIPCQR